MSDEITAAEAAEVLSAAMRTYRGFERLDKVAKWAVGMEGATQELRQRLEQLRADTIEEQAELDKAKAASKAAKQKASDIKAAATAEATRIVAETKAQTNEMVEAAKTTVAELEQDAQRLGARRADIQAEILELDADRDRAIAQLADAKAAIQKMLNP